MTDKKVKGFAVKEKPVDLEALEAKPVRLCCYVTPALRKGLKGFSGDNGLQLQKVVERILTDALEEIRQQPQSPRIAKLIRELKIEEYTAKKGS